MEPMSEALARVAALPPTTPMCCSCAPSVTSMSTRWRRSRAGDGAVRLLEMDALRLLRDADEAKAAEVG